MSKVEQTQQKSDEAQGRYADVNGLHMYYEVHGRGQPLVLLHGGLSATETSFGMILPAPRLILRIGLLSSRK
jgi:pimeloyl-ACP methyl ester carboxylesterase